MTITERILNLREVRSKAVDVAEEMEEPDYDVANAIEITLRELISKNIDTLPVDLICETINSFGTDCCLITNCGQWIVAPEGYGLVEAYKEEMSSISCCVEKQYWAPTIREAIKLFFTRYEP